MEAIQIKGADRDLYVVELNRSDISLTTKVLYTRTKALSIARVCDRRLWTTRASDRKPLNS